MTPLVIDASVWVAAADPTDPASPTSRAFLERVAKLGKPVALPAWAHLEVACALARRLRNAAAGRDLAARLLQAPAVQLHHLEPALLEAAGVGGTNALLRAGDAIYAAVVERVRGDLISWDRELLERVRASTPDSWLRHNA